MIRALLLALAVVLAPALALAQPTIVQVKECEVNDITTGGAPCSFDVTPTTGSGRYVIAAYVQTSSAGAGTAAIASISDNQSNTYTIRSEVDPRCMISSAPLATSSGTVTVTANHGADQGGLTDGQIVIFEISGLHATVPLDNADANGETATSATPTINLADTSQGAFIVGNVQWQFVTITPASGFTRLAHSAAPLDTEYRTEAAAGAFDPNWTIDFSNDWNACGAAFAAAGGGGGGGTPSRLTLTGAGVGGGL